MNFKTDMEDEKRNEKIEEESSVVPVINTSPNTMEAIKQSALQQISKIANDCNAGEKDVSQGAKEALSVATTVDVAQDEGFRKKLQKKKKKEIDSDFEADMLSSQAEKAEAKQLKREAFYTACRPILELDFSNITGIEPKRKIEREGKTFSYTVPVMLIVLPLATVLFLFGTVSLMFLKLIETVCEYIVKMGTKAVKISFWSFIVGVIILVSYIIINWLESSFGLKII